MKLKAIEVVQVKLAKMDKMEKEKSLKQLEMIMQDTDKELAIDLKKAFDVQFHPTWHCVVGKNFGSQIGFEDNHMLYFHYQANPYHNFAILIWKAG